MTDALPGPLPAPQPPELDRSSVDALVDYAHAQSAFWRSHIDLAHTLGKPPGEQAIVNVDGWEFVACALAESYDD